MKHHHQNVNVRVHVHLNTTLDVNMLPTTDRDSVQGQFGNLNNLNKNVKNTSINDIQFRFLNVCGLKKRLLWSEKEIIIVPRMTL